MNLPMKKVYLYFIFLLVFVCWNMVIYAQSRNKSTGGIYFTYQDFINDSLSVTIDFINKNNKLIYDGFLIKPYVTIKKDGNKFKFYKNKIYAIKNKNHEVLRVHNGEWYKILDTSKIYVYSRIVKQKKASVSNSKFRASDEYREVQKYYFSVLPASTIKPLTAENIKLELFLNPLINNTFDIEFNKVTLSDVDTITKTFKINSFLKKMNVNTNH